MVAASQPFPTDEGNIGDITEAFYSFDVHGKDGVTDEDVLTIFLGLGYQPIDVTIRSLVDRRERLLPVSSQDTNNVMGPLHDPTLWTLDQVVRVLSQVWECMCV
jgi:hypothetical protein